MLKLEKRLVKKIISIFLSKDYGAFGENSKIYRPKTFIVNKKHIFIGKNVLVRKYARIEPIVQWHEQAFNPKIIIGDGVTFEQNLHLTCANRVEIGDFSSISSFVFITDIDHEYRDSSKPVMQQPLLASETVIGKCSFVGTGVKIMAGVHIGEHSVIGANSVVTHDIPPYSVAAGIPAKVIKKFNFETNQWEKTK